MSENQDLRKENQDLFSVRDMLLRDQELVCKENERLLRKLEEVNTYVDRFHSTFHYYGFELKLHFTSF